MTTLLIAFLICLCVIYRIRLKLAQNATKRECEAHNETKADAIRCRHMWKLSDEVATHYARKCGALDKEDEWPEVIG